DDACAERTSIRRSDIDTRGAANHVTVGEHEPVRRHHHAGAGAAVPRSIVAAHVEPDDGRAQAIDDVDYRAGIDVEQLLVVGSESRLFSRPLAEHHVPPSSKMI